MLSAFRDIQQIYTARGFIITEVKADLEFECLTVDILPVKMDCVDADDHVGEIERANRTTKQDLRVLTHGLPYRRWTKLMVKEGVRFVLKGRNQFPADDGISETLSPATIVTGAGAPDYAKMAIEFGSYVKAFNDRSPTNRMNARSTGGIALTNIRNTKRRLLLHEYFFRTVRKNTRKYN